MSELDQLFSQSGDPNQLDMGFPTDPLASIIPAGLNSTQTTITPAPAISSAQQPAKGVIGTIWDTIKQDSQSALAWGENEALNIPSQVEAGLKNTYNLGKNAVGTVVSDVTEPVRQVYWYAILGIIVIAGALYFIGKGGAVKVNAIV